MWVVMASTEGRLDLAVWPVLLSPLPIAIDKAEAAAAVAATRLVGHQWRFHPLARWFVH